MWDDRVVTTEVPETDQETDQEADPDRGTDSETVPESVTETDPETVPETSPANETQDCSTRRTSAPPAGLQPAEGSPPSSAEAYYNVDTE
ncbi:unnamed protein product [Gadus morhua 'NCC']